MNSRLYKATVMHHRLSPKPHRFNYKVFMFYVDLDELELLSRKFFLFSLDRFNFFSFRKNEHLQLPKENPDKKKSTKENIVGYLKENGFEYAGHRIMLLTNMNILGFNFNPVSFYFIISAAGQPECAIAEVSNTFREMKPYFLGKEQLENGTFLKQVQKQFYVSPFIDHDADFAFRLEVPGEKLNVRIDDHKNGERFFISTLTGFKKELSNKNLLFYGLRFPFLTLRILTLIHWNAVLLWLKKIPYRKKEQDLHLQQDVYRKYQA